MRMLAGTEIQATVLKEIRDLYEKRGKLEEEIRALDAMSKLRIEEAALRDIEVYRTRLGRVQ